MNEIDREQLICTITLTMNYSEDYLRNLSDEKLIEMYERTMGSV